MIQFTISCVVELLKLVTSDDIMTSSLRKLSISIKIHIVKFTQSNRYGVESVWSVSKLSTESVESVDSTVESRQRRRCVGAYATRGVARNLFLGV